jgi:hypothetical protein
MLFSDGTSCCSGRASRVELGDFARFMCAIDSLPLGGLLFAVG